MKYETWLDSVVHAMSTTSRSVKNHTWPMRSQNARGAVWLWTFSPWMEKTILITVDFYSDFCMGGWHFARHDSRDNYRTFQGTFQSLWSGRSCNQRQRQTIYQRTIHKLCPWLGVWTYYDITLSHSIKWQSGVSRQDCQKDHQESYAQWPGCLESDLWLAKYPHRKHG